jgi:NAD(P)-dependent dehydrogenase (short-subunit alcohol dehydrogenase family)
VKTFLVTGSTQGLGLAIARALAADSGQRVVLGVRDLARGADVARAIGSNVEAKRIDCASLTDVRRFAAEWEGPLAGLVNNAGVQFVSAGRGAPRGAGALVSASMCSSGRNLTVRNRCSPRCSPRSSRPRPRPP